MCKSLKLKKKNKTQNPTNLCHVFRLLCQTSQAKEPRQKPNPVIPTPPAMPMYQHLASYTHMSGAPSGHSLDKSYESQGFARDLQNKSMEWAGNRPRLPPSRSELHGVPSARGTLIHRVPTERGLIYKREQHLEQPGGMQTHTNLCGNAVLWGSSGFSQVHRQH